MKLVSWNVNGLRAVHKKGLFVPFVEKYKPDVICLQETKAQQGQAEIDLPGYEEYWNSAQKKGYSGTAIFVKTTEVRPLSVRLGLPDAICKKYKLAGDSYGDPNLDRPLITYSRLRSLRQRPVGQLLPPGEGLLLVPAQSDPQAFNHLVPGDDFHVGEKRPAVTQVSRTHVLDHREHDILPEIVPFLLEVVSA